jgi:hypothetical protein
VSTPVGPIVGIVGPLDATVAFSAPADTTAGATSPWAAAAVTGAPAGTATGVTDPWALTGTAQALPQAPQVPAPAGTVAGTALGRRGRCWLLGHHSRCWHPRRHRRRCSLLAIL